MKYTTIASLAAVLATFLTTAQAATIYSEDFELQEDGITSQLGLGIRGPGDNDPNNNITGVTWDITTVSADMNTASDYMEVREQTGTDPNLVMRSSDPGGQIFWFSPTIDITGATNMEVSFLGFTSSIPTDDEWSATYEIDGGGEVVFFSFDDTDGSLGTATTYASVTSGAIATTGDEMVIRVYYNGTSGGASISFDDVTLTGDVVIPEPTTAAFVAAGLGLLALRRRRA